MKAPLLPQGGTPYDVQLRQTLKLWLDELMNWLNQIVAMWSSTFDGILKTGAGVKDVLIGDTAFRGSNPADWARIWISGTTGSGLMLENATAIVGAIRADATNLYIDGRGTGTILFRQGVSDTPLAHLNANGRFYIGFGGSVPSYDNCRIQSSGRTSELSYGSMPAATAGSYYHMRFSRVDSPATLDGQIYSTSGTTYYATTSDRRVKRNIADAPSAADVLARLRVVSHDWVHDDGHVPYSFIAQEVADVYPRAVSRGGPGDGEYDDGTGEFVPAGCSPWGLDNSVLVPVLTKALQEQQAQIAALSARVARLESR